jgi:hypothetical protein
MTAGRERTVSVKLGLFLCIGLALSLVAAACGESTPEAAGSHHRPVKSSVSKVTTTTGSTSTTSATSTTTTTTVPTPPPKSPPADPPSSTSVPAEKPAPVTSDPNFKGIYEFAGGNSSTDATAPDLAGVVLIYYWSQIEPQKGAFDWNLITNDMAPWVAAGKKVILRISTSGQADWDPPYSGDATPQWVFEDGAQSIVDSGETIPVYWDQAYLTDYSSFVQSFSQEFNGNPSVAFIEAGIGMGGETLPETNGSASSAADWDADGYTDALWLSTVEQIASFYQASFTETPVYPLVDETFFGSDQADLTSLMDWFRSVPNWGLQDDGLTSTVTLGPLWSGRPIALEERDQTQISGDCLCADISNGLLNLLGTYLLLYQSDIDNPANAAYLRQAAAGEG